MPGLSYSLGLRTRFAILLTLVGETHSPFAHTLWYAMSAVSSDKASFEGQGVHLFDIEIEIEFRLLNSVTFAQFGNLYLDSVTVTSTR